ncbi:MAG: ribose-phosphate diphosphokinase, partial [Bacteroidota bacterium]
MKFLNLDPDFEPFGPSIAFEHFTFNGGEPHIKIKEQLSAADEIKICTRIRSFNDLGLLLLAADALRRMGVKTLHLLLPYFPAARQDRVMLPGEALSVKLYADLINAYEFREVTILDPHSAVTAALLERVSVINNHELVEKAIGNNQDYLLIAPDGGALKKIYPLSKHLGGKAVIECSKHRDVHTGALSGFVVHAKDLQQKTCVIVDDICDGGGTFVGLAKKLKEKNAGNLILVVSHGIFSKGFELLSQYFSAIYSSDSFSTINHRILKQIKM